MNLCLAELLNSVPPEFSVKKQDEDSIQFYHENKEIYIDWWCDGQPCLISCWENSKLHRPSSEGPARQTWKDDGTPVFKEYWENGKRHYPPSEGPARQVWNEDGSLRFEEYWENGKFIK